MAIQTLNSQGNGGLGSSKAHKVGMGYATGGPAGAGLALAGANNPTIGGATAIGRAIGKSGPSGSDSGNVPMPNGSVAGPDNNYGAAPLSMPQLGQSAGYAPSDPMSAIQRRMAGG